MEEGIVYIIGAGCGDFDLITLRGMTVLKRCGVIVYDSLIDKRLLEFAPEDAEKICVGKRAGSHSETQENINKLLVEKALAGNKVARLKGGDPFVFGRGGEEISALQKHGISYDIIPGITSAVAAAELAGIPVTHRRLSRSFHVITGHTADEITAEHFKKYAGLDGTLVFLMGLNNLRRISEELISSGISEDMPAAVISHGAASKQKSITSTLRNIADEVGKASLEAPAVIIVGETAGLDFSPKAKKILSGISVAITGTKRFIDKMNEKLISLGAETVPLNTLNILEYKNNRRFDESLRNAGEYGWIVLTSANGAEIFFNRMHELKMDIRILAGVKFAVIGSGTAEILEKKDIYPELMPEIFTSSELGTALANAVSGDEKVLILRAENGTSDLTNILTENNIRFDEIKTYLAEPLSENIRGTYIDTDFLIFASASGVQAFFSSGSRISEKTKIVCIGEVTAGKLRELGINDFIVSDVHTSDGIIDKIILEV